MNADLRAPQTIIALVVLAIVAGTIVGVFLLGDAAMRNTIGGLVVGTGLGSVTGYYFGFADNFERITP